MKKITLFLIMLSFVSLTNLEAQISTFPYTEDFESGDGGWVADNTTNGTWALGTPAGAIINSAASGANAWVTNLTGTYNTNENSWVTSPVFDFSALSAPAIQMSIWYDAEFSWDGAVLQSSIDNGTTWVNVGAMGDPNNWYTDNSINGSPGGQQEGWSGTGTAGTNAWVMASNSLASLAGQANVILRVAFGSDGSIVDEGFGFDNINVYEVLCPEPSDLTVSVTTATGATITWTDNGTATIANLEVVETGVTPTGTPNHVGVSSPYSITGLTSSTTYDVYIQADCGSDQSVFVGPISFSTECTTFVAPYTEGFENGGVIPLCWSMAGNEEWYFDDDPGFNHIGNDGIMDGNTVTNNYFAWCDSSGDEGVRTLTSPLVDVSGLIAPALSFYEISHNEGNSNSTLEVEVWDGAAWNLLGTYNSNTVGWELKVIDLSSLTITGDVQARFLFSETTTTDFYDDIAIDDVTFDEAPSCFIPTQLSAVNTTATGAELSWSQVGSVSLWNVEIVIAGTTPTGVPTDTDVSNPFIASGLSPATDYEYYVQANCGTELSGWAGPFAFTTECTTFTAPYTEPFENNGVIPLCWTMDGNEDWFFDNDASGSHIGDVGVITGTTASNNYFAYCDASGDEGVRTLTSPLVDVSTLLEPALSFYEISDNEGNANSVLNVEIWDGASWIPMETYDSNTNGWELKVIDMSGLTITGDVQARFIFSEVVTGDFYDDIAIDDVTFDEAPSCFVPSDVTSVNLSTTSTVVSWTDDVSVTSWNIEYDVSGFTQGTGTYVPAITTNPYQIDNLTPDTYYDFYIQSICGVGDESIFLGPYTFYTGYCVSEPTTNNFDGVNNVTIGVFDFPSFGDVTYENHTATVVNVYQNLNTNVQIEFGHTSTYDTNIWIDYNDDLAFDDTELVYQGESPGGSNPHFLDASFTLPNTATPGQHRMRMGTANTGQAIPDPCYNGTAGVTLDFTVNILQLNCTLAEANYYAVTDCDNNQFFIDVDITSLGDATSLEVSTDYDTNTIQVTQTGVYQMGPFPFGTSTVVYVMNEQDNDCIINSSIFDLVTCPPDNDDCEGAVVVDVNEDGTCNILTSVSGTILSATPSGVPTGSCTGSPTDDVWYQFTAISENQIISLLNIEGSTEVLNHAVYSGTCGALTELYCTTEEESVASNLTIGETYYLRIFSQFNNAQDTTFDLCIRAGGHNVVVDQTTYTIEELVTDVLIGGECAQISNITYSTGTNYGSDNGIGYFSIDGPGFPFDEGLLLTSGDASIAGGPNTVLLSDGGSAWPGDAELDAEVGVQSNNASIIEFDFVPLAQNISFDFLMASEEYNGGSFECTYSDAFAFLLTDSNGVTTNLAVLPGTTTPILVTNIHEENTSCAAINNQYFGGYTGDDMPPISFDGRTAVFTAQSAVNIGESYHIKLVIADASDTAYDSGVFLKAGSFDLGQLTLGDDVTINAGTAVCLNEPVVLDTQAPNLEHVWYKDGLLISGETSSIITVTEPAVYTAQVIFSSQCIISDEITVEFLDTPVANTPSDLMECSATNQAFFDLTENDDDILGSQSATDYTVTYHLNEQDAIDGLNPLTSPYANVSSPQIIYARIESNNTGCYDTTSFFITISEPSHIAESVDLIGCDDDGDGIANFDFSSHSLEILNGQDSSQFIVTYYLSEADAIAATNALSDIYDGAAGTVYVRVESVDYEGCFVTNSFNLIIGSEPVTSFSDDVDYEFCPNASLDLEAIPENYSLSEVSITWYRDGGIIAGENSLTLSVFDQGFYEIEVMFNDTGCIGYSEIEVIQLESCEFPQGISPGVSPGQNDTFDLSSFNVTKLEIFNRNGTLVYSKNNYVDEWHGQTNDGKELPVGTYFYTVIYEGGAKSKSAWVYINR
ncbi:choice-of-anchor L domain-containing protein [Winogradskyella endarachnes]|uniref:T9SS type B sorting domain-containing protein n=1 Tax=Winogradskyella endarachnes TaxID=2681965 RepID=A0A6L6UAD3_9FLAO|nr:choice-of-anchor L domain-containing protein [Winogradskyella endarachnes]MUU79223.1 hypothetical protein [Winogradskyella endarachnes]